MSAIIVKQIGNCCFGFIVRRIIGLFFGNDGMELLFGEYNH